VRIYQEYALHAQAPDACCALTHALHALAPDACCALTRTGAPLPSLLCGTRPACSRLGRRQPARARACPLHRLGGQCGQPCGAPGGWCGRTRSAPPSHTPGFVCTCAPPPSPLGGAARARQAAQPQLFQCLQVRTGPAPGSTGSQAAGSGRRQGHAWDRRGTGLGLRLRKAARQAHRGQRLGDVHRVGVAHDEQLGARRGGHPPHGLQRARALELTFMLWTLSCWPRRQARFPASRHAPRRSGRGPLARLLRSMAPQRYGPGQKASPTSLDATERAACRGRPPGRQSLCAHVYSLPQEAPCCGRSRARPRGRARRGRDPAIKLRKRRIGGK